MSAAKICLANPNKIRHGFHDIFCLISAHDSLKASSYVAGNRIRSESGYKERPFVIDDYFLELFSLEEHLWKITPHRNASIQRMVIKFYNCTNTK